MRLLVVNPNTGEAVTQRLRDAVAAAAGPAHTVDAVTARFGARYIACEASYAVAAHAVLDAWAAHRAADAAGAPPPDAVLVGCFGDPGVTALRELSGRPAVGLAEAAMREAAARGRYVVVTGGAAWGPMLHRLALALGLADALAGIRLVAASGAELAADPDAAVTLLRDACRAAVTASPGVRSVVLGGAGLAGLAERIQDGLDVPLVDSVAAGARAVLALALADSGSERDGDACAAVPPATRWHGLSPALIRALDAR